MALHEVMMVNEEIERLAVEHAPATEISAAALRSGMVTLRNDGMTKVLNGVTSIDEILRVVV
jgi:type IV pilus assembly protein PilB